MRPFPRLRPLFALLLLVAAAPAQPATEPSPRPDDLDLRARLQPLPGHVERGDDGSLRIDSPALLRDPERHVWGGSVLRGSDGRYHMFHARFAAGAGAGPFGDEWLLSSEIAHAVSDHPARGFRFAGVVLRGRRHARTEPRGDAPPAWDEQSVHNPHVRRFDDRVYLYWIASHDPGPGPTDSPATGLRRRDRIQQCQRIGVVHADDVAALAAGDYTRPAAPLLTPRTRVKAPPVVAPSPEGTRPLPDNLIVVNPSVLRFPADADRYLLYFKGNLYDPQWRGVHGVAYGPSPTGPFAAGDDFVFDLRLDDGRIASAEDPFVWYDRTRRRLYAIVKDFTGHLTGGPRGLALLTSTDGLRWQRAAHPLVSRLELRFADGTTLPVRRLERPQLLRDAEGVPRALYCACIVGGGYAGHACNVQLALRAD